jgi:hypothetical protein
LYNRFVGPDKAAVERGFDLARSIGVLQTEGFHRVTEVAAIPVRPEQDYFEWLSRPPERHEAAGLLTHEKAAVFPDHTVRLVVLVPFQDGHWERLSARRFEQDQPIEVVLSRDEYQRRMRAVDQLICIGLASRRATEITHELLERNEELAFRRSRNLCRAAASVLGQNQPMTYWVMSFGQANNPAGSDVDELRQRTAVLIGVRNARQSELDDVIKSLVFNTDLDAVNLRAYSESSEPHPQQLNIIWQQEADWDEDVLDARE